MSATRPFLHSAGCPATHRCDASAFIDSLNALVNGHINASRGEIEREVERAQELLRKHFEAKDAAGAVANGLHCNQSLDALLDANAESNAAVQRAVAAAEALTHPQTESASSPLSAPSSPLSPVDAEDLAQSLDSLLEVIPKNCMGQLCLRSTSSEQLIASYHAQQEAKSTASVPAQTVTSDDLAKALRRIIDRGFADNQEHELLDRYEAQIRGSNV